MATIIWYFSVIFSAKPMLKKVAKTETRLAKFDKEKLKKSGAFRAELKSTGNFTFR